MADSGGPRVLVIGLDCAEPSLVFDRWRGDLPNLASLMDRGAYGKLRTCIPPITVPAWTSMLASRDPGQLGFYGFRNRGSYAYEDQRIANAAAVSAPRVWDVLTAAGRQSVIVGVPQTYPVPKIRGHVVSDFLTPPGAQDWTHPESLAAEITTLLDGEAYEFDVKDFRTEDKAWLLESVYRMTDKRWKVVDHLVDTRPWDFFMVVEMGIDRMHHGFWRYMDPQHILYEPASPFADAIHDYYVHVDHLLGGVLAKVGADTAVLVVSDHGARRMEGGFCLNEWLMREGYLSLSYQPEGQVELRDCRVDWPHTRAWGSGGYYGRLFLNVKGREPEGVIAPEDYEAERDGIAAAIEGAVGPDGRPLGNVVYKPQDAYREVRGIAPDLIVYCGNLAWRSVGSLGHGSVYTRENDTGPDEANHSQYGILVALDPRHPLGGQVLDDLQIESVGPTILAWLGVDAPSTMMAAPLFAGRQHEPVTGVASPASVADEAGGYSAEEEEAMSDHLAALGYL